MRMRRIVGVWLVLQTSWVLAQTPLAAVGPTYSVAELVRTVLAFNPALNLAQLGQVQAQAALETAKALPNPRLEWSGGRAQAPLSTAQGAISSWGASQLLENPYVREARSSIAREGIAYQQVQILQTQREVIAHVRHLAYEKVLRQEEVQAASEGLILLEQTKERVRLRVNSGEAPRYEIIKADAEAIHARQRQQTAQLALEQTRIRLNQLAAGQLPTGWRLRASLEDPLPTLDRETLRGAVRSQNAELQALRTEVERQRARVREAQASRWPGVEIRYAQTREPEVRQGLVGASIQMPLLDQRQGPLAESRAELMRAQTRLESRESELTLQLDAAWAALEMARLRVDSLGSGAIREAEAALRVSEAAYRFGERGILDVLDAQRVLRSVRADLLQARFQLQAAAIEIDVLTGREFAQP
jgi:cobalt-zinc-cadmium efflux system outer membrane protein